MLVSEFKNQIANKVHLNQFSQRIVSLVPSITELLYELGLENQVVGVTKFCTRPSQRRSQKTVVGGTKCIDIERVTQLKPTIIFANKEENVREQVESLAQDFPIYIFDIKNWEDAIEMIKSIGIVTSADAKAGLLCQQISVEISNLQHFTPSHRPTVSYLIWRKPYMTVGGDTYIDNMLELCGFRNVFNEKLRYPVVDLGQILATGCDFIFLSSEPFPFKQRHIAEMQKEIQSIEDGSRHFTGKIMLVDGEMFSWYGSRLLPATAYFKRLQEQVFADNPA